MVTVVHLDERAAYSWALQERVVQDSRHSVLCYTLLQFSIVISFEAVFNHLPLSPPPPMPFFATPSHSNIQTAQVGIHQAFDEVVLKILDTPGLVDENVSQVGGINLVHNQKNEQDDGGCGC